MREQPARVLRGDERFRTSQDGIVTRHCFSFGNHYEPDNIGFGDLVAINDEYVDAGRGYDMHRHSDAEIVTWVLEGALRHEDSTGDAGTIRPGEIQRMSAGAGVSHCERNASNEHPVRFIQMWLRSDAGQTEPTYEQADIADTLCETGLAPAVSSGGDGAVGIGTSGARLWIGRVAADDAVTLPEAPLRHLHVVRGHVDLADIATLEAGDTVRLSRSGHHEVVARTPSEVLLWGMSRSS